MASEIPVSCAPEGDSVVVVDDGDDDRKPIIITIGSRQSKLALIQTEIVKSALEKLNPHIKFRIHAMTTTGDNNLAKPLHSFGAKSLWTLELEELLLDRKLDLIVHSLKDMPTQLPAGCKIGAILEREDPRDAVVMKAGSQYKHISQLPPGSVVGTSSVRRSAQVAQTYAHLKFHDVRGNVGTRLAKLDDPKSPYSCLVLAAAGLIRLDLGDRITHYLSHPFLLHAVGQGALGVEIRDNDERIEKLVSPLIHGPTYLACLAERSLMRKLEGGCSVPIGVETGYTVESSLLMYAVVASIDGTQVARTELHDRVTNKEEAEEFGRKVAARLTKEGANIILSQIKSSRETANVNTIAGK